ncbi:Peptidase C19, ubiquitin carboxyl-terminal hydrolase 2 [Cordyceps fumosorosea ARSEF 2679]|uniref:ubiquitinyl hydrolase 1 n=1 Tax=Cordyceps fumosorosea (strain ARSEF 2679) TaxID=1081104 RepID=A0A167ZM71_CORFA|nr:Peptidase C19, ubiquitin carboxyl-terminal hydrolase 2 [Cordyceps fumosorosea ARSEF 2679]OAA67684.1 Peptidase C19, ubiquitin carboxyl-terminal hydrolase 2 [Cordyceps fumosorosea ARSEF 2679]
MNFEDEQLVNFYHDRVSAHRRLLSPTSESLWDRFHWSGWSITLLVLAATLLYRAYGQETTLDAVVTSAGNILLEALIFVLPARVIFAVDSWINPSQPMSNNNTHTAKSDAMRRIIGLDRPGGVMATVLKARSRALSATSNVFGVKAPSDQPPGLGNIDNSCYQNSILQGLSSLDSIPEFLSTCLENLDTKQPNSNVAQTLKTLISDLNDLENSGQTLWTPRVLKSMSTWTQQDAQEYYSKILDDIEKSVATAVQGCRPQHGLESDALVKDDATPSEHSDDSGYHSATPDSRLSEMKLIRNPLEGLLAQRVACIRCGHSDGISMIPFNCLTLSLGLDKNQHDLYERLDAYTKVEAIEGVECPKCTLLKTQILLTNLLNKMKESNISETQLSDTMQRLEAVNLALEEDDFDEKTLHGACKISPKSKVMTTKTKQIVIGRPPQSLVVHMNRSVFDPTTFDMIKNSAPVHFPMTLDLGPWCLGSSGSKAGSVSREELWPTGSMASLIAADSNRSRLSGPIYELRAAVTHYGRHENGHYICYRKYPRSAQSTPAPSEAAEATTDDTSEGFTGPAPEENARLAMSESKAAPAHSDEFVEKNEEVTSAEAQEAEIEGSVEEVATGEVADPDTDAQAENRSEATTPIEPTWWRLSDNNVSKVSDETVMSLSPGVFMLFYECVDSTMVLDAEEDEMQDAEAGLPTNFHSEATTLTAPSGPGSRTSMSGTLGTPTADTETDMETETEADANEYRSDAGATETDDTTVGTAESASPPDSDSGVDSKP